MMAQWESNHDTTSNLGLDKGAFSRLFVLDQMLLTMFPVLAIIMMLDLPFVRQTRKQQQHITEIDQPSLILQSISINPILNCSSLPEIRIKFMFLLYYWVPIQKQQSTI
jgi:hypothetical protein